MNTYSSLRYHVIIRTLDGNPLLTQTNGSFLCQYLSGIIVKRAGMLLDAEAMPDHIHLLLGMHPSMALADMIRDIKALSSKWLNENHHRRGWFRWQPGYGAFSVSESQVGNVRRFFRQQHRFHEKHSSEEELIRFIEKHGFEYDTGPAERRRHTYVWSRVHVIFSTKLRMTLIPENLEEDLFDAMGSLVTKMRANLLKAGGMPDHVHLVLSTDRTIPLTDVLQTTKTESTYWMRDHLDERWMFSWQRGYGAFTVSLSELPVVLRYVECQKEHHRQISFKDELHELLLDHGLSPEE